MKQIYNIHTKRYEGQARASQARCYPSWSNPHPYQPVALARNLESSELNSPLPLPRIEILEDMKFSFIWKGGICDQWDTPEQYPNRWARWGLCPLTHQFLQDFPPKTCISWTPLSQHQEEKFLQIALYTRLVDARLGIKRYLLFHLSIWLRGCHSTSRLLNGRDWMWDWEEVHVSTVPLGRIQQFRMAKYTSPENQGPPWYYQNHFCAQNFDPVQH